MLAVFPKQFFILIKPTAHPNLTPEWSAASGPRTKNAAWPRSAARAARRRWSTCRRVSAEAAGVADHAAVLP